MSQNLLVATRKGLFILSRSYTGTWDVKTTAFLGDPVSIARFDKRSGFIYAALNLGHFGTKLHRSEDGGTTWREITCPTYPPFPDGQEPDRCPMRNIEIPWKLEQIWAMTPGGEDQRGRIWCGSIPGGLFKSDDHGMSWQFVRSLWDRPERHRWFGGGYDFPGIHSICVDPRDSRTVRVAVSCGGIWETTDDGASWEVIGQGLRSEYLPPEQAHDPVTQDPHLMVQCLSQPDRVWVQHHNGIFASSDSGHTFTEIENAVPSSFGFAVAVHPHDPDTAWFAPAIKDERRIPVDGKLVVTRTRDGGKTFIPLSNGFPSQHAYDLIYRHALSVDSRGERLALGSTTGNLWTSESRGDHWAQTAVSFPPIHSVDFF